MKKTLLLKFSHRLTITLLGLLLLSALLMVVVVYKISLLWMPLLVLAAAMAFVFWFYFSLTRPVVDIFEGLYELAQGKYAARVRWSPVDSHNQWGSTFNRLAEKVQTTIQDLAQERAHFDAMLSTMVEGVLAVDKNGKILHVNPALKELFNLPIDGGRGKHYLEVLRHSDVDHVLKLVLEKQQPQSGEIQTFDQGRKTLQIHAEPLQQSGQFIGALLVMHDITRLRELEKIRREFVANVSHELHTPLSSIKGFAETLQMGGLEDKKNRADFVHSIEIQTDRMIKLVDDLLDLSRIESGQHKPQRSSLSLRTLALGVLNELQPLADRKKIKTQMLIEESFPSVLADADQMRQVFSNLLQNALKSTGDNGSVTIKASIENNQARILVEDTGPGIPAADLPRIFERFYRVDKARSRELGGTGLGLAIVRHIVEGHGGRVRVEGEAGEGATLVVELPVEGPR